MNPCSNCYSPGRPCCSCLFLAARLALGYSLNTWLQCVKLSASLWFSVLVFGETRVGGPMQQEEIILMSEKSKPQFNIYTYYIFYYLLVDVKI